jgi:hypothetical protein
MTSGPKVKVRAAAARQAKLDLLIAACEVFVDSASVELDREVAVWALLHAAQAFVAADRSSPTYAQRRR